MSKVIHVSSQAVIGIYVGSSVASTHYTEDKRSSSIVKSIRSRASLSWFQNKYGSTMGSGKKQRTKPRFASPPPTPPKTERLNGTIEDDEGV